MSATAAAGAPADALAGGPPALQADGLCVRVGRRDRSYRVVDDVSLAVPAGGALGIVGESGSGKSMTLRALMALLPAAARAESGQVLLDGAPVPLAGRGARAARRQQMAIVLQDSLAALDPVQTVGDQIAEVPRTLAGASRRAARQQAVELLELVGIPAPALRARSYPHQLSGGMRQRVAIAMALATQPRVLLCDEPTTALDVTVQAQVLELIAALRRELGLALVFVSHDIAVVGQVCDEIAIMYTGRVVESGPAAEVLAAPRHPYTRALLGAVVDLGDPAGTARPVPGALPHPAALPYGCTFHPRCPLADSGCTALPVPLLPAGPGRASACLHHDQLADR